MANNRGGGRYSALSAQIAAVENKLDELLNRERDRIERDGIANGAIDRMCRHIEGNGNKGLLARVTALEEFSVSLRSSLGLIKWTLGFLGVGVIAQLLGLLRGR